jgi:hypothetical protein
MFLYAIQMKENLLLAFLQRYYVKSIIDSIIIEFSIWNKYNTFAINKLQEILRAAHRFQMKRKLLAFLLLGLFAITTAMT